jgi:hypothetical protein
MGQRTGFLVAVMLGNYPTGTFLNLCYYLMKIKLNAGKIFILFLPVFFLAINLVFIARNVWWLRVSYWLFFECVFTSFVFELKRVINFNNHRIFLDLAEC